MCKYTNKLAEVFKKSDLEILIATMNRNNLDFLIPMFPFAHFSEFSLLIINQTNGGNQLFSEFENVRVINSYEKGLSKSRNLALENATKKILLIADDDVVFIADFDARILKAHQQNLDFSVICFQTLTTKNKPYSKYRNHEFKMHKKHFLNVLSIELSFKTQHLREKKVVFNEHFGLGAQFEDAESLFFLRRANYNHLKVLFCPENIVFHKEYSSSDEVVSDRLLYAKMAGFYKKYQFLAYFLLLKFVFFLIRKRLISTSQILPKIKVGLKGVRDYKALLKSKKEELYS